jgi:hypothetical protein
MVAVLPWLALGGLFYLMAKNSGKLASSGAAVSTVSPPAGTPANNAGCNDFGAGGATSCWCG